jgi:hypothetical protein
MIIVVYWVLSIYCAVVWMLGIHKFMAPSPQFYRVAIIMFADEEPERWSDVLKVTAYS